MKKRARRLPADDPHNGWVESLESWPSYPRLEADRRVDCAVVGGGFTGLAIARRLHEIEPNWSIVVLDAQRLGQGTSARSSGFVVDLTDAAALMRPHQRDAYVRVARSGIEYLRDLVTEEGLDCAWDERGWIRAAASDPGQSYLDRLPAIYDELRMAYEPLDREAMAAITGSHFYRAGIRVTGYPLVHSGMLLRGLLDQLPDDIEVFERSPVQRITSGTPGRLETEHGSVEADRLFLATNGYSPSLGIHSQRVFPLYTFGSLTRPLTLEEQESLGGEQQWGILAMDPMGSTVRRTHDQRILIRNWVYYNPKLEVGEVKRAEILDHHRQAFEARFPDLRSVDVEYTWAGLMGSAHNSMITFGQLGQNLWSTAGFTAAGIAMGHAAGRLLADLGAGRENPLLDDALGLPKATWMPPEPFRSLGGGFLAERMNRKAGPWL